MNYRLSRLKPRSEHESITMNAPGAQGALFDNQTGLHLEWDHAARRNSLEEVIGELMPLHCLGNFLGAVVDRFETHVESRF